MKRAPRIREIGLHAVDLDFVREQLVPWVLGEKDGALPRIDAMAQCLHTRYQANVVGRALVRLESDRAKERVRTNRKPGLLERLFKRPKDQAPLVETQEPMAEPDGFGVLAAVRCSNGLSSWRANGSKTMRKPRAQL